jgi:uncharacterized protein YndB with AHSA1/START domain
MNEYGQMIDPHALRIERVLPGPIERVWSYLTESEKRRQWFARGEMEPREGGALELIFQHSELSAEKEYPEKYKSLEKGHHSTGKVLRWEPPHLLVFRWDDDDESKFSEVTFELTPKEDKVLLTLTHRRLKDRTEIVNVSGGWHAHLAVLEDQLAGREPRGFWTVLEKANAEYETRIPKA